MAAAEEINWLRTLTGVEADGLFLRLMIPHHRGGVAMAEGVLARTKRTAVLALAQAIVNAQQNEIAYMQELLERKDFQPVPDEPAMDHSNMSP